MKFKKIISGLTAVLMAATSSSAVFPSSQIFAEEPVTLYADINQDGTVNVKDLVELKNFLCSKVQFTDSQKLIADLNNDSELNIIDYIMLKNILLDNGFSISDIEKAVAAPDMTQYSRSYTKADTAAYNQFAANSAAVLFNNKSEDDDEAKDKDEENKNTNPVYSPISVYMAFSMLAECSDGQTLKEITDALCADDIEELRKSNKDIFNNLYFEINQQNEYGEQNNAYCKIANSMWFNKMYSDTYNTDTIKTLADSYYTSSFYKDFADEQTPKQISNWINKNTSGKFSPDIKIENPSDEVIKIINTITFKDSWKEKFDESQKDIFHTADNQDKECEFLNKTFKDSYLEYGDGYTKTSVEMNNNYKMNFVLPDDDTSVDDIVSSSESMLNIFNENTESKKAQVIFSVPEFNVSSKFDLIEWAKKLGMSAMFSESADLTGISDWDEIGVSEITHEATILINETGCEAAAYTMISVDTECDPVYPDEQVEFKLDKPFFYYVSDNNGTPVFSGVIYDPTSK